MILGAHSLASPANIIRQHTATGAGRKGLRIRVLPHDAIGPLVVVGHSECYQLNAAFHKKQSCRMLFRLCCCLWPALCAPQSRVLRATVALLAHFWRGGEGGGGGGAGVTGSFCSRLVARRGTDTPDIIPAV